MAIDLESALYGSQFAFSKGSKKSTTHGREMPTIKDTDVTLLEERPTVREEKDIVLLAPTKSAIEEILLEHNRADVLRSYGLYPA